MITNESARELVNTLRAVAARNKAEREKGNEYWKGQSDGRADAYNLAADWLKILIPSEPDEEEPKP